MLKYGIYAKAVELLCFKPALARLSVLRPDMDIPGYKKKVKQNRTKSIRLSLISW